VFTATGAAPWRTALIVACIAVAAVLALDAQTPAEIRALSRQAEQRIKELQAESDRLAKQTGSVLGELRKLEVERAIKTEEMKKADAELAAVTRELDEVTIRLKTLEAQRLAETPGIRERLVEIYKRGRAGYLRMLLAAEDVRAFGRMSRGVAAVAELDRLRFDVHRQTIRAERAAQTEIDTRRKAFAAAQSEARRAKAAVDRALAAQNARLDALDRQRDLAARYVGELEAAQAQLEKQVVAAAPGSVPSLPLAPFRGSLDWPLGGRVISRFGRNAAQFGTAIIRNGIEIAAATGSQARAVHGGTVAYAAPFTGFGTLVIVDHGASAFTLYGHLSEAIVTPGTRVNRGTVVGRTGRSPAGLEALYFELRIDGRPVDPVQWLRRL
jgi:septal ring factor EnvC (AmiA/AmiB activator)